MTAKEFLIDELTSLIPIDSVPEEYLLELMEAYAKEQAIEFAKYMQKGVMNYNIEKYYNQWKEEQK